MYRTSIAIAFTILASVNFNYGAIRKYPKNHSYLEYQDSPILLFGGTDDDNLYQWPSSAKKKQLDRLVACGGNYDRCTMSYRDEGKAAAKGKSVLLGQMFQNRHINQLESTEIYAINHPSIFDFIDFSPIIF